jgi:HK97 family phage prohead protease
MRELRTERLRFTTVHPITLRQKRDGDNLEVLFGEAAVFYDPTDPGSEYQLYSNLKERIMPGCFDRALRERADVVCLWNHDANFPLARVSNGSMKLSVTRRGLLYEAVPGDTSIARDVMEMVRTRLVAGSSFSFSVLKQAIIDGKGKTCDIREIHDVELFDVSPCLVPAYSSTTAGVRARMYPTARSSRAYSFPPLSPGQRSKQAALLAAIDARLQEIKTHQLHGQVLDARRAVAGRRKS